MTKLRYFPQLPAICFALALAAILAAAQAPAEPVTIYRDEYGIPHIYAETAEAGMYAQGYAMAEDALARTLENFLRGLGKYSEAFGPGDNDENVRADLQSLMWDHYGTAKKHYHTLPEALRRHNAAFVAGINDYMERHPEEVPGWWTQGAVDVYMPVAFSRQFIWGWPLGQAASDLRAIGLRPNYDVEFPYSNEMALAPKRTTFGAAALVIDPHLSWYARFRYWEVRIHAGDIHISGFATAGFPYVNLGHNRHVAWAHTTGGPDTADVYELTLNPENIRQYLYDGEYRDLTTRTAVIHVKGESSPRTVTFYASHHGPIIARAENKAYAAKLAYADEIGYLASKYYFMTAKNYRDVMKALEIMQIMPQNVMVADTGGNIYYQRTGRTPIRPNGVDPSRPLDGSTSATEWKGIHPTSDLIHVLNPTQGYMQNCNITPDVMMVNSPMTAGKYRPYIFNQPPMYTHQRATRATEVLHTTDRFSVEALLDLALDRKCYQYERWIQALRDADKAFEGRRTRAHREGLRHLSRWDGFATKDSSGALMYYYWRRALLELAGEERVDALVGKLNNYLDIFGSGEPRQSLTGEEHALLIDALVRGATTFQEQHGGFDAVYGDVFRVGRLDYNDTVSFPVGGGSLRDEGMATVRAVGFTAPRDDHTRWGTSGQTSTQVVILTDPIQSFTQPPLGQSDHEDSPHFRDQARELFSEARFKPSWFHKDELLDGHVESELTLEYRGN